MHFYPAESLAATDAGRMAERWYTRLSPLMRSTFDRRSLIFYANSPDFQQTNVLSGFIDQGTGGVTESLRGRVIMPFQSTYGETDHVLGHELVHVFQYNIAFGGDATLARGLGAIPLWVIEGMAEYLSVGRFDPLTAMWMRDAVLRDDLPTLRQLCATRATSRIATGRRSGRGTPACSAMRPSSACTARRCGRGGSRRCARRPAARPTRSARRGTATSARSTSRCSPAARRRTRRAPASCAATRRTPRRTCRPS